MTISQELDAFLDKHNRGARDEAKVSLWCALILWPACLVGIALLLRRGMLAAPAAIALAYLAINLIVAIGLILAKKGCDPVADGSALDDAQNRSWLTRLPVVELSTLWQLLLLPGKMTADVVLRWRSAVSLDAEGRQAAETLMTRLRDAGGAPLPIHQCMLPASLLADLVTIGAVRQENDRYGNPTLSRRLPPE